MRAFLDLLGSLASIADLEKLAPLLAPGELEALRTEGFLQPTGSDRFDEVSVPDVIRTVRALWGAGAGGIRTRSIMSHAPMTLGCLEIDAEPVDLVLVTGDAYSLEAAAKRRERSIVLVPTDHALTPELRLRHGSRALVAFVALSEALGVRGGRVCRIDLPVPMPSPLRARTFAPPTAHPPASPRSSLARAPLFEGVTDWGQLTFIKLDNRHILVRFRRRSLTLTAQDLGLLGTRSRQPRVLLEMLMAFCENDGCLKGWRFGRRRRPSRRSAGCASSCARPSASTAIPSTISSAASAGRRASRWATAWRRPSARCPPARARCSRVRASSVGGDGDVVRNSAPRRPMGGHETTVAPVICQPV